MTAQTAEEELFTEVDKILTNKDIHMSRKEEELVNLILANVTRKQQELLEELEVKNIPLEYSLEGNSLKYESGWVDGYNACSDLFMVNLKAKRASLGNKEK